MSFILLCDLVIYILLFYLFIFRNSLKCIDPLLMAPTCIFLASKVEVSKFLNKSL